MKRTITDSRISTPALGLGTLLALAAAATLLAGCGADGEQATAPTSDVVVASPSSGPVAAVPAMTIAPTPPRDHRLVALGDSLPPEIAVAVEDSLVHPGDVVEITAEGSDDVSQVGLSDGLGRMQLFTHDPASNVWHVLYRVPLKSAQPRLALSVTALNDLDRWRRVWVFVDVQPKDAVTGGATASTTTPEGSALHASTSNADSLVK